MTRTARTGKRLQDEGGLGPREAEILRSVIREHLVTGGPVGSRTLSRGAGLDLSPATIRNIMADLEERGLLIQPHASAGRVPTDRGYRFYVDRLMDPARMSPDRARAIEGALLRHRGAVQEMLEEASRQLSRISRHVGVVLAPEFRRIVVEHVEFVRLNPGRVVAILVDRSGMVHNRILQLEEPRDQSELDRIGAYLSERFSGCTLPEMRRILEKRISEERAAYDRLVATSLELGRRVVERDAGPAEVFVEGASNLLGSPDFEDLERMKDLLRTLETKSRVVDLLSRVLEGGGLQVVIGSENPVEGLDDLSVVASPYRAGGRVMGSVGIVGPTRMEYARTVALVDYLARLLTRVLSSPSG